MSVIAFLAPTLQRARASQTPPQQPPASAVQPRARSAEEIATSEARKAARRVRGGELYAKYCTECHGTRGEGHIADNANSLRSRSFLASANSHFIDHAIRYGRPGTAMAAYHQTFGGPLKDDDFFPLVEFVYSLGDVKPVELGKAGHGDVDRGKRVYRARCESCHGSQGKGLNTPSLNDPLFLATASGPFIRYAITEGRDGTVMPAFRNVLTAQEIEDVTAYVQSWSRKWIKPGPVQLKLTNLADAVVNSRGAPPELGTLKDDIFVTPAALKTALDRESRIILLDARPPSAWAIRHIPGAVPLPYYDAEKLGATLPKDGTWIVAYCECPTSLARRVISILRKQGFKNTAVLDEGLAGWVARRFPLASGTVDAPTQ